MPELYAFLGRADRDPARLLAYATCHAPGTPELLVPGDRRWWTPTFAGLVELATARGVRCRPVTDGTVALCGALPAWNVVDELLVRLARVGGRLILLDDPEVDAEAAEVRDRARGRGVDVLTGDVLDDPLVDAVLHELRHAPPARVGTIVLGRDEVDELVTHLLPFAAANGPHAGLILDVEDGRRQWTARCLDAFVAFTGGAAGDDDVWPFAVPPRLLVAGRDGVGPLTVAIGADTPATLWGTVDGVEFATTAIDAPQVEDVLVPEGGRDPLRLDRDALIDRVAALVAAACEPPTIALQVRGERLRLTADGTGEPPLTTDLPIDEGATPGPPTTVDGARLLRALQAAPAGRLALWAEAGQGVLLATPGWRLRLWAHDVRLDDRQLLARAVAAVTGEPAEPAGGGGFLVPGPREPLTVALHGPGEVIATVTCRLRDVPDATRAAWCGQLIDAHPGVGARHDQHGIHLAVTVDLDGLDPDRLRETLRRLCRAVRDLPTLEPVVTRR